MPNYIFLSFSYVQRRGASEDDKHEAVSCYDKASSVLPEGSIPWCRAQVTSFSSFDILTYFNYFLFLPRKAMMSRSLCSGSPSFTELSQAIDILKHTIEAVEEEAVWSAIEGMGTSNDASAASVAVDAFSDAGSTAQPSHVAFFGILSAKRKQKAVHKAKRRKSKNKKHSLDPLLPLCCWQISRCYWAKLLTYSRKIKFAKLKEIGIPVESVKGIKKCKDEMKLYLEKGE